MLKRLKRNFILVTMLSVVAVLIIIMAVVNGVNYYNQNSDADFILNILLENGGAFPDNDFFDELSDEPPHKRDGEEPPPKPDDSDDTEMTKPPEGTAPSSAPGGKRTPDSPGIKYKNRRSGLITVETPYEQRYFSVELNENAEAVTVNTGNIAAVTEEEALEMAAGLMAAGKSSGYDGTYKYTSKDTENGKLYVFLDRTRDLKSVNDLIGISLLVALGAAAAIFVLVFIFSDPVIKPIAESYEKQKQFITNAGHEIKTPLAVISSCVDVMELEQGENKWTKGVRSQVERLSGLTANLVALARMDEGQTGLKMTELSFTDIVNEVLEPFEIPAEQKGIAFRTDIAENITLKGDPDALAQLCSIMADNAVKYTPEDGEITFSLTRKGRHIIFSSDNTAENIEKGNRDELFDRFHRGDSSRSSDKPGYGIGMSMLRSIASAHGAKTEAYSPDGKRLIITVKF